MTIELEPEISALPAYDPHDPPSASYREHCNMESLRSVAVSLKRIAVALETVASKEPKSAFDQIFGRGR